MTTTTISADMMISLDGCITGPNATVANPGGDGAATLHSWIANLASWRARQGLDGGEDNEDSRVIGEWFDNNGAVIMGRNMYDSGAEFWGDDPPFKVPVFVLTHRPHPPLVKDGGTSFTFVTDGIESALEQARAVAGERNIDIGGGASTFRQYLEAGLVEEIQLHLVPVLLGNGLRLFDRSSNNTIHLEPIRTITGNAATHLKYRFIR
jgi:dihydrofolate reductase